MQFKAQTTLSTLSKRNAGQYVNVIFFVDKPEIILILQKLQMIKHNHNGRDSNLSESRDPPK